MAGTGFLIDTQLLVLLVAGLTSTALIGQHKRLKAYSPEDFNELVKLLGRPQRLLLTPHVLAETSNLLRQIDEPARGGLMASLAELVRMNEERTIASRDVVSGSDSAAPGAFGRLGLTDAALLALCGHDLTLLTADAELWAEAKKAGLKVTNFAHRR